MAPGRYGAERHTRACRRRGPTATRIELALAAASARGRTCRSSGICRGMQVMAVAAGGVLEQHVPDRVGHDEHSPAPGVYGAHAVHTVAGTRLARLLGDRRSTCRATTTSRC